MALDCTKSQHQMQMEEFGKEVDNDRHCQQTILNNYGKVGKHEEELLILIYRANLQSMGTKISGQSQPEESIK